MPDSKQSSHKLQGGERSQRAAGRAATQGHMGKPHSGLQAERRRELQRGLSWGFWKAGNSGGPASLDNLGSLGYRHGPLLPGPWPGRCRQRRASPFPFRCMGKERVSCLISTSGFSAGPWASLRTKSSQEGGLPARELL